NTPQSRRPTAYDDRVDEDEDEGAMDDDLGSLPPNLVAEAQKLVYGDWKPYERRASEESGARTRRPTIITALNESTGSRNGSRKASLTSQTKKDTAQRNTHYLASLSDESSE